MRRTSAIILWISLVFGCSKKDSAEKTNGLTPKSTPAVSLNSSVSNQLSSIPVTTAGIARKSQLVVDVDPTTTSWKTESFADSASMVLKSLARQLESSTTANLKSIQDLFTREANSVVLIPKTLTETYRSPIVTVKRGDSLSRTPAEQEPTFERVKALSSVLDGTQNANVKMKIVDVQLAATSASTKIYAEGRGLRENGSIQWTARWQSDWHFSESSNNGAKIASIRCDSFELVESRTKTPTWLIDETAAVFQGIPEFERQFFVGMDTWVNRLEHRLHVNRLGHHGIAIGDANGDGRDDIYVCHTGGLPNRLFLQMESGKMQDVSHSANVDFLDDSTCALFVDLDNDGDQDLVVATISGVLALENDGKGLFQLRVELPECRNAFSLTAADVDRDRLLDLYVGRYWPSEESRGEIPIPVPFFDAQNGGKNVFYRNLGWQFADVTQDIGLDEDNTRYTMAAAWEDLDSDGDIDLYVANDFGRNCWYRNDNGHFSNQAAYAGIEDIATGMSVSFADYNHDGHLDLYVGNMFSAAGNRVAYQRFYSDRFQSGELTKVRRLARGNSLFSNQGDGQFQDVSELAMVTMGRWAWGSIFMDVDNDGWEDLMVANGHITTSDTGDL